MTHLDAVDAPPDRGAGPGATPPTWWKTQSAPLGGVQFVVVYALLGIPPIATLIGGGGASAWSFVLWVPMIVLATVWSKARARRDGAPPRSVQGDAAGGLVIGGAMGLGAFVIGEALGDRVDDFATMMGYVGLWAFVAAAATEPYFRRRYRRSFTEHPAPQ